ncbi:DNA mismatch repair protein MutL containing protein [Wuchereria bancrofti]|uniref:DNA mismatch repair protein MutL containing protein n=1 Tax=Wuchereria bancrofti TaxID=6293 RepID=J9F6C0_WUCBA|nr:DNA mismatch repair protein MutL containing protein [Wuchereria bancrofti]
MIRRLPENVVNRIAAGEVIVRAANAIKELIENALDAGATEIIITAKNGGLDLLKVQDNGKGIAKNDLAIVCERFTTSKLEKYEDLECMSTFGFRGEALASISHVAKVTIISKTSDSPCAYVGRYTDSKLQGDIKPSAGLDGTSVTAEDLFYNCPSRRRSLKYPADEMNRIADIVVRYAIHNPSVSFTLRRCGSGSDFRTAGTNNLCETISSLLGGKFSKDLVLLNHSDSALYFTLKGCFVRPTASCTAETLQNRQNCQKVFYLFINGRSVECQALKQALDVVFAAQNTMSPFVMISLQIEPRRVDVNVHPTKSVVYFLEQDSIISSIQDYVENLILSSAGSCDYKKKKLMMLVPESLGGPPSSSNAKSPKVYPHQLVRTDAKERRLEEFVASQSQIVSSSYPANDVTSSAQLSDGGEWRKFEFESLQNMKKALCTTASVSLRSLFKEHIYIGAVNIDQVLIQHSTSIYLVDARDCLRNFFYQILVLSFGNFGSYKLSECAPLTELLYIADSNLSSAEVQQKAAVVIENREMLDDYFCLSITENGNLNSIPSLIDGFIPQLESLPQLILTLANDIIWDNEQTCFEQVCWALSEFFCLKKEFCDGETISDLCKEKLSWKNAYQDILFPALKINFLPPQKLISSLRRIADLHDLYKVFERC